jgi:hypothetical protein
MEPEMIWGSESWHLTSATVLVWPVRVKMLARVRISHTRTLASRPAVHNTSRVGWTLRVSLGICQLWMSLRQRVDTREVTVVVSNDFIRLQIPTFHHFVFSTGEQVGVSV